MPSRTLVVARGVPGPGDVGGILLAEMLNALPWGTTRFVALAPTPMRPSSGDRQHDITYIEAPREAAARTRHGRVGSLVSYASRRLAMRHWLDVAERRVVKSGEQGHCDRVWVILNTPATIEFAERLHRVLKLPLYVQVWDDASYLCQQHGLDRLSRQRVMSSFARVLRMAHRVAVISEAMAEDYSTRYGARCCIVRYGLSSPRPAQRQMTGPHELRIGMSGSMYCASAWNALLAGLDACRWAIGGRKVRIRLLSADVRLKRRAASNIEFLGWRPQEEVLDQLADCDVLYLPQPFERHLTHLARLSFPTKLSTYVATGRPVFVHAPTYASVPRFCRHHQIGIVCSSTDPDIVARAFRSLVESPVAYAKAAEQCAATAREAFSREMFSRQVNDFLSPPGSEIAGGARPRRRTPAEASVGG